MRFETATPVKFVIFRLGLITLGRYFRTLIRKLLQRRLITGLKTLPIELTRVIESMETEDRGQGAHAPRSPENTTRYRLRVTDEIRLTQPGIQVRRMSYGTDHQSRYVAACGLYQESVLEPWTDLSSQIAELNERGCVTIVREF